MSESDSEDDSFFDITKKLSAMKNNFNVNDVDLSQTISEPEVFATSPSKRSKNKSPGKLKRRRSVDSDSSGSIDLEEFRSKYPPIEEPKSKGKGKGRGRGAGRGKKKKCEVKEKCQESPNLAESQLCLRTRRKRSSASTSQPVDSIAAPIAPSPRNRGRGRGRGRGRRGGWFSSRQVANVFEEAGLADILRFIQSSSDISQAIATYSVGNTDEYPDQCNNQQLFSQTTKDVVQVDLNESLEDNEEFSVKVYWRKTDIFVFKIRKHQKLTSIYNFFAKQEDVTHDKLLFTYQDRILRVDDTPGSIDYSIARFIDGGIVTQSVVTARSEMEETSGIKLKFQCQNVKRPFELYVKPEEKMSVAMLRCAEHLEKPVDQLRFLFDGDLISGKSTPQDLELEGGECIDVKILS